MTRISSLFAAATLAILPITAFAQPDAAPAKNTAPAGVVDTTPRNAPAPSAKTLSSTATTATKPMAPVTQPAKPDVKTGAVGGKTEMHGMNTVKSHDGKANMPTPAKTAEPTKS